MASAQFMWPDAHAPWHAPALSPCVLVGGGHMWPRSATANIRVSRLILRGPIFLPDHIDAGQVVCRKSRLVLVGRYRQCEQLSSKRGGVARPQLVGCSVRAMRLFGVYHLLDTAFSLPTDDLPPHNGSCRGQQAVYGRSFQKNREDQPFALSERAWASLSKR